MSRLGRVENLKPFKPGFDERRNLQGNKNGTKHLSKWIQDLSNDTEFTVDNVHFGGSTYKGAPIQAIVTTAIYQALSGDVKWAEWLAKHGWGTKVDLTTNGESLNSVKDLTNDELDERIKRHLDRNTSH